MVGEPQFVCNPVKGPLLFLMSPDLLLNYEITLTNAGLFRINGGPPMAGDELKTLLFAELDTNNLTDTLLTKLGGIETGATADQTDVEIKTAYENNLNTNAFTDANVTTLSGAEQSSNKGVNNGYTPLDGSALVPLANLPASVKTGSEYKGEYNATTNTPTLINGTGSNGDYHRVNVAGTQDFGAGSITFSVGDIVVYNGTTTLWQRIAGNPDLVSSVAGKQGVVTLDMDDLSETVTGKIFSDVERTKLTGIETGATADQSDAEIETAYNNQVSIISQVEAEAGTSTTVRRWTAERVAQAIAALESGGAVTSVAGKTGVVLLDMDDLSETVTGKIFSDVERTKLTGIETSATADQSDAEIETAYNNQVSVVSQVDAEAGTSTIVNRWTAERVSQAIAALAPGGGGSLNNNFINSYDTTTQTVSSAGVFQALNFNNNNIIDGWTHTVSTNVFGCNQTGSYEVSVSVIAHKSSGGGDHNVGVRGLFNGTEIAGSYFTTTHGVTGVQKEMTTTFMFDGVSGQNLTIEFEGSSTNMEILPGPTGASPTVNPSAKISIKRIK